MRVAGTDKLGFGEGDVEEDFDPEEHDRRMAEVFGAYDDCEVEGGDEQRPEFSDLGSDLEEELEVENWDDWAGQEKEEEEEGNPEEASHEDNPDFGNGENCTLD